MKPEFYITFFLVLYIAAYIIFRVIVRSDYQSRGKLSLVSTALEWAIFVAWGFFTWFDYPVHWKPVFENPVLRVFAWCCIVLGSSMLFLGIFKLGFRRSNGREVNSLRTSGWYSRTRNPQIISCAIAVFGYALIWPSWHTLGWIILYAAMAHMMVLTEEEHLSEVFGSEYDRYRANVPRYLKFG